MNDCEKYANACKTCRVATGQEVVSEKYNFRLVMTREKSRNCFLESGKIDILKKSQGKWKYFNTADLIRSSNKHLGSL